MIASLRASGAADRRAWGQLVARHQARIFAICCRMVGNRDVAADLTQDTFVKVIQGAESYDGRAQLTTWMTRIAMNVCLSHLRAQKLRRHASLDALGADEGRGFAPSLVRGSDPRSADSVRTTFASSPAHPRPLPSDREQTPASSVESSALHRAVSQALASLDPEQRAILVLRDVQGLEYDQIAAALEVPGGTVKSRLFRARLALREALEKLEPTLAASAPPSVSRPHP